MGVVSSYTPSLNPREIFRNTIDRYKNAQDYADDVKGYVTNAINTLVANGIANLTVEDIKDLIQGLFTIDDSGISGINPVDPDSPDVADIEVGEPTTTVPSRPELQDLNLDDIVYTETDLDLTAPDNVAFNYTEEVYSSDLAVELNNKVIYDLINGGTGLDADTEQAIWDRAQARQQLENEKAYNEAMNFWASRGFSMPPGMLNGTLLEARARIDQNNTNLNNDILVQSSDLAQKNTQFIISTAVQIEKNLMDNWNQYRNRALEAAKAALQAIRDIYQIKLDYAKAKLTGTQLDVEIYKARIEAAVAKLDIQLRKHLGDIETYKAAISYYDSQVRKIIGQADARVKTEGLKVETFKAESGQYGVEVDAVTKAFLGKIDAAKSQADALIKEREGDIQMVLGKAGLTSDQVNNLARIAGQLAAASLTSVSAGTNIGVSHSQSDGKSYTEHKSDSEQFSVSHTAQYPQPEGTTPPSNPTD